MNTTILDFAIISSGIIGYFISFSLVTSPFFKSRANNYLSLSLFLLTSLTILDWYDTENIMLVFLFNIMLDLLFAVTLFTYFVIQINHHYLKTKWYKWLYAPFFCSVIIDICIWVYFGFYEYDESLDDLLFTLKSSISYPYNVFLILWGRNLVKRSNTISESKKHWLLRLNFFVIGIILIWLLSQLEVSIFDSGYVTNFLWILISILSWWILYYGVFRLQIVIQKDEIHQYLVSKNIKGTKPKRKINEVTTSKIITQLYTLMNEEELYKNPLLSRLDLANRLGTNEMYLSQVINQELNKSIISFVNEYRIEAAKKLLHNPIFNKYSLEAIGMEAGFKSKSTFYSTFKKSLGMSPGAFRKLQKTS